MLETTQHFLHLAGPGFGFSSFYGCGGSGPFRSGTRNGIRTNIG